jgi:hypothetical protein
MARLIAVTHNPLVLKRAWFSVMMVALSLVASCDQLDPLVRVTNCPTKATEITMNLRGISLALERYAADNGVYPATIQSEQYVLSWPRNDLADHSSSAVGAAGGEFHMIPLEPGATAVPGGFVYLPEYRVDAQGPRIIGYELYAYGKVELEPARQLQNVADGIDEQHAFCRLSQRRPGGKLSYERAQDGQ